jgi:hypothetical protein
VRPSIRGGVPDKEATEVNKIIGNVRKVTTLAHGNRYRDVEDKEITIVDENRPALADVS